MPAVLATHTRPALPRDRRGVSALEFCLIAPLVMLVVACVADIGNAIQQSLRLEAAARAGAQYALTFPSDAAAIQAEVRRALPGWTDATVSVPGLVCHCGSATAAVDCTTYNCTTVMRRYLSISVDRPFSPMVIGSLTTLTGRVELRIQ